MKTLFHCIIRSTQWSWNCHFINQGIISFRQISHHSLYSSRRTWSSGCLSHQQTSQYRYREYHNQSLPRDGYGHVASLYDWLNDLIISYLVWWITSTPSTFIKIFQLFCNCSRIFCKPRLCPSLLQGYSFLCKSVFKNYSH